MNVSAKTLLVVAVALTALLAGYQSGAERAEADVGPFGNIYAATGTSVLLSNGEVWNFGGGWQRDAIYDPPVPPFEIGSWMLTAFITRSGDAWSRETGAWVNYGPTPDGIRVEESSIGAIKAKYGNANGGVK